MLRLEPNQRQGDVVLSLHERTPLWRDPLFQIALALAVVIHLLAFGLLKIPELAIRDIPSTLPITALADSSYEGFVANAELGDGRRSTLLGAPPRSATPMLPHLLGTNSAPLLALEPSHPFASLETAPRLTPLTAPTAKTRIELSGPIADEELLTPTHYAGLPSPRVRYAVRLDQREGKIIWMMPLEPITDRQSATQIDTYIRQLRFRPRTNGVIIPGELSLTRDAL